MLEPVTPTTATRSTHPRSKPRAGEPPAPAPTLPHGDPLDLPGSARLGAASLHAPTPSHHPHRTPEVHELRVEARATREGNVWRREPLTDGSNAHRTNTPEEMREALDHDYNWLEGDLRRRDDGVLVMSHDSGDAEREGLTFDEWLDVGAASHRGLKVDVKESEAMPELLDKLAASGIPQRRLMVNDGMSADSARSIRAQLPHAWLAINPATNQDGHYDSASIARAIEAARAAGGRVAFPLRWDLLDDDVIRELKPYGRISVWTAKSEGTPDDPEAEAERLRARGVDGVIDLGEPSPMLNKLFQHAKDIFWQSGAARDVRSAVTKAEHALEAGITFARDGAASLVHGVEDGVSTAIDVAQSGADKLRAGASHVPVVGGLFD